MDKAEQAALVEEIVADQDVIFRAMRGANWSRHLHHTDLTMPQMRVLMLLDRAGEQSMSQLAETLERSLPSVGGMIDRLVESGVVQRAGLSEDRRVTIARLTPEGQALMEKLSAANLDLVRRFISRLSGDELRLVRAAMTVLRREAEMLAQETASASAEHPAPDAE